VAKPLDIRLSEGDLEAIIAAAARSRGAPPGPRPFRPDGAVAEGFPGIADLVPPLPGLPGGHASIRGQVFSSASGPQAPGVSEAIRRAREGAPDSAADDDDEE
jgi:hypothetical protein